MKETGFKRIRVSKRHIIALLLQNRRLVFIISLGLFLWFLYSILAGDHGLFRIFMLSQELKRSKSRIEELKGENEMLQKKKEDLLNDLDEIEKIGRTKYDLVRENEIIYKFEE
jgi:cell division protein FtsB